MRLLRAVVRSLPRKLNADTSSSDATSSGSSCRALYYNDYIIKIIKITHTCKCEQQRRDQQRLLLLIIIADYCIIGTKNYIL